MATGLHYPRSVPEHPPFAACRRVGFDTAQRWSREELSLPMFPELTETQVAAVQEALCDALEVGR